jgi:hypothetical protein
MTTYYLWSGASGAQSGASWADAFTTLAQALSAANADGDLILAHWEHDGVITADTTYNIAADIAVISVDKDAGDALRPMGDVGYFGNKSAGYTLAMAGAKRVLFKGLSFQCAGTTADFMRFGSEGSHFELEDCLLSQRINNSTGRIRIGMPDMKSYVKLTNCVVRTQYAANFFDVSGVLDIVGGRWETTGATAPTQLFDCDQADSPGGRVPVTGMDLSGLGYTVLSGTPSTGTLVVDFTNCKMPPSFGWIIEPPNPSKVYATVTAVNCSSGDQHYQFSHHDALGGIDTVKTIVVNDALDTGDGPVSWRMEGRSAASRIGPYVSPWIDLYHEGVATLAPYVEVFRDGDTTPFDDGHLWVEVSYQGDPASPMASFVNDRSEPLTPADPQAPSGKSAADWLGSSGTGWAGVLGVSGVTPASIGYLRARVMLAGADVVYVDPQIRGVS